MPNHATAASDPGASAHSFAFYRKGPQPGYIAYERMKEAYVKELRAEGAEIMRINAGLKEAMAKKAAGGFRAKSGDSIDLQDSEQLMQGFSVKYADAGFIGLELMPLVPTPVEGVQYMEYLRGPEFGVTADRGGRGTRTSSQRTEDYERTKRTVTTQSTSETGVVGKDEVISPETPVDSLFEMRELVDSRRARKREVKIHDLVTDTANYSATNYTEVQSGVKWNEPDGDIGADIEDAIPKIWRGTGSSRLVCAMGIDEWKLVKQSTSLLNKLSMTHSGFLTPAEFCEFFGLDGLLVSDLRIRTSNIAEAATYSRLWSGHVLLARVSMTPELRNASLGFTFRWTPPALKSSQGIESNLWFDPDEGDFGSFVYKRADKEIPKIVAADTAFLFKNPFAT